MKTVDIKTELTKSPKIAVYDNLNTLTVCVEIIKQVCVQVVIGVDEGHQHSYTVKYRYYYA